MRHRKSDGSEIIIVLVAIAAVLAIIAIPFVWIWYEMKRSKLARPPFVPTRDEIRVREYSASVISKSESEIRLAHSTASTNGLRTRNDSMYDERNPVSANVNTSLRDATLAYDRAQENLLKAESGPQSRYNKWIEINTWCWTLRAFLPGAGIGYLYTILRPAIINQYPVTLVTLAVGFGLMAVIGLISFVIYSMYTPKWSNNISISPVQNGHKLRVTPDGKGWV